MKTRIVLAFAVVMLALGCQQNQPTDDPEIIKKILFDYFDGIKAKDLNKLNELTTKDFVLFEGGSVWNNDSLIAAINEHYKSFDPTYSFDNFEINVDSRIGNMRYYNHCDCIIDDTIKRSMDWVESATFVKVDGKWKMDFLHSSKRRE
jgi:hypothetical protein